MTTLDAGAAHVAASTPYAWPYDGDLGAAGTAVLVVRPAAVAWPHSVGAEYAHAGVGVVETVRSAGVPVISVITANPGGGSGTSAGDAFAPDATVSSPGIDGFYASALEDVLRSAGVSRLILVGFGLETCVHSTMRSANDRGLECLLVADACEPYDPELAHASVSMIEMSGGIFGAVATAASVIAAFTPRSAS